jgi:hypothetical protein
LNWIWSETESKIPLLEESRSSLDLEQRFGMTWHFFWMGITKPCKFFIIDSRHICRKGDDVQAMIFTRVLGIALA